MSLSGLAQLNLEITNRCSKQTLCAFCAHQQSALNPVVIGDMRLSLVRRIREQLEPGVIISLHRDGEPTDHPQLRDILNLFSGFVVSIVTHGERLVERADELIGRCTSLCISVFRGDPDGAVQYAIVKEFLRLKNDALPQVQIKIVGDYGSPNPWEDLGVPIIRRLIHSYDGSKYAHTVPTRPEVGVCLDLLHRPTIGWDGTVYLCNRMDGERKRVIGDAWTQPLDMIWNGSRRQAIVRAHLNGQREQLHECRGCQFWGVPSQWQPQAERVNYDELIQVV